MTSYYTIRWADGGRPTQFSAQEMEIAAKRFDFDPAEAEAGEVELRNAEGVLVGWVVPPPLVGTTDHGPRVQDGRRARTWRERLNRAVFAARSRVTFRAPELEALAALAARRVRCDVYAERNGFSGRAVFGGV